MNISIKHCRIRVNFYFFALLCVIAFFDRSGMLLAGLVAALLHECGHLAVMLLLPGQTPSDISVTPFGIRIHESPLAEYRAGHLAVLAAGSGVNFFIGSVTMAFCPRFAALHFVMGAINLLPVDTLDGGGILRILLRRLFSQKTTERLLTVSSLVTLTALSLAGVYVLFRSRYNFTLLGMSLCLLFSLLLRLSRHKS